MAEPKRLSLPGLYIINKITFEKSAPGKPSVAVFAVTDSHSQKKRLFRFDSGSIATTPEEAIRGIERFIRTGKIDTPCFLKHSPTPPGYSQSITMATFERIRNQPCLVRYTYAGENIGMIFYPHEFSF